MTNVRGIDKSLNIEVTSYCFSLSNCFLVGTCGNNEKAHWPTTNAGDNKMKINTNIDDLLVTCLQKSRIDAIRYDSLVPNLARLVCLLGTVQSRRSRKEGQLHAGAAH